MVAATTSDLVVGTWTDLVGSASTRHSSRPGCVTAAAHVHTIFDSLGLSPEYQQYRSDWAPNVIGTIEGISAPDEVYIVIGHLDDMPDSDNAPGADDNASGSAMAGSAAKVMAQYRYASTVKFLAVTGEEQGLVGAYHYAGDAAARGENIIGVLNADMNGWEGDGFPALENLDLPYNSDSEWLADFFAEAAADYATGCPVNLLHCPTMFYSDHAAFWDEGFSAILGMTDDENLCGSGGSYPYYHTSSDTLANCGDPAFYVASVKAYVAAAAHLADPLCRMPDAPAGLVATADGPNRIALSWTDPGSSDTYEIHRAPGGCGGPLSFYQVGETANTSWVDTTASGGIDYAYVIRGRDATGYCVSLASGCAEATTTGDCLEPPAFGGVTAVSDEHGAHCTLAVSWDEAQPYCGPSATYNVYRSTTSGFVPDLANRVAIGVVGTSYVDSFDLVSGTPYFYVVRAVDSDNGAEETNTVEGSGTPTGPLSIGTFFDDAGDTGSAQLVLDSAWDVAANGGVGNSKVYATGDYDNNLCSGAATPPLFLAAGGQLSFWSKYDIEDDYDKGEVQISTDGGGSWERVEVSYPGTADNTGDACGLPTGDYFTGTDSTFDEYTASLDAWAGHEMILRWVLSSDVYVTESGWWVDDITITQVAVPGTCESQGDPPVFTDGFESGDTSVWSTTVGGL